MKILFTALMLLFSSMAFAQKPVDGKAFPAALTNAKTVAIVNDTHTAAVSEGAIAALRAWGRFTVVEDPDTADVTLRFDKNKEHSGQDSQKPDPNTGDPSYSYSMSFNTSIHLKVYLKDADTPFYSARTDEAKKKAGMACVSDFRSAMQARTR